MDRGEDGGVDGLEEPHETELAAHFLPDIVAEDCVHQSRFDLVHFETLAWMHRSVNRFFLDKHSERK
jgi:hypothetical protein